MGEEGRGGVLGAGREGKERPGVSRAAAALSRPAPHPSLCGCCPDPLLVPLVWPRGQETLELPAQGAPRLLPELHPEAALCPTRGATVGWTGGGEARAWGWAARLCLRYPPRAGRPGPALLGHQVPRVTKIIDLNLAFQVIVKVYLSKEKEHT